MCPFILFSLKKKKIRPSYLLFKTPFLIFPNSVNNAIPKSSLKSWRSLHFLLLSLATWIDQYGTKLLPFCPLSIPTSLFPVPATFIQTLPFSHLYPMSSPPWLHSRPVSLQHSVPHTALRAFLLKCSCYHTESPCLRTFYTLLPKELNSKHIFYNFKSSPWTHSLFPSTFLFFFLILILWSVCFLCHFVLLTWFPYFNDQSKTQKTIRQTFPGHSINRSLFLLASSAESSIAFSLPCIAVRGVTQESMFILTSPRTWHLEEALTSSWL